MLVRLLVETPNCYCLLLLLFLPVAIFESSSFMLLSQRTKSFNQILIERWSRDFFAKINWDQDFWTFLKVWKDYSSYKLKHQASFRLQFLKCRGTVWYIADVWRWGQCPYLSRYIQIDSQNSAWWSHRARGNLEKMIAFQDLLSDLLGPPKRARFIPMWKSIPKICIPFLEKEFSNFYWQDAFV